MTFIYLSIFFIACFFELKLFIRSQRIVREFGVIGAGDLEQQEKRNKQLVVVFGKMILIMVIAVALIIVTAYVHSCITGQCWGS